MVEFPMDEGARDDAGSRIDGGLDLLMAEAFGPAAAPGSAAAAPEPIAGDASAGNAGRFEILKELGRGGMGVVHHARDHRLGRDVALKVLRDRLRDHLPAIRRFVEEARIGALLEHPGIVPIYDLGVLEDGSPFLAMKLVSGRTLAAILRERTSPAADRARLLAIILQACQAVAFAHARGVIHRDLKPSNILVGDFGEVQVLDWGLAASTAARTPPVPVETEAGAVVGTFEYMSPEQAQGERGGVDARSDVFAIGSMLCEILTGKPAYAAHSREEVRSQAESADLAGALARLRQTGAESELSDLARRCLDPDPQGRPADSGDVAAVLARHLAGIEQRAADARLAEAAATARAEEAQRRASEARRARRWILALGIVTVVSLTAGFAFLWSAQRDRAGRQSVAELAVSEALGRARQSAGRAQRDPDGDPGPWEESLADAREAAAVARSGPVSPETRRRTEEFLDTVTRAAEAAREAQRRREGDTRLVERLDEIAAAHCEHLSPARLDRDYTAAFQDHGLDMLAEDQAGLVATILRSRIADEIVAAVDNWGLMLAGVPQDVPKYHLKGARLLDLADHLDASPQRARFQAAAARGDVAELRAAARDLDLREVPPRTAKLLAFRLRALGEREAASGLLRRAVDAHPGDFWLNLSAGASLEGDAAVRFLTAAAALRPRSTAAITRLAIALRDTGRPAEARTLFERAAALRPEDGRFQESLSAACEGAGDLEGAVAAARRWTDLAPKDARAWFRSFQVLERLGRPLEASAALEAAIGLDGARADWRYALGRVLLAQERFAEAAAAFDEAKRLGKERGAERDAADAGLHLVRELERIAPAFQAWMRSASEPETGPEVLALAGYAWHVRRFRSAADLFAEAFERSPGSAADIASGHRWVAAKAAALAATGSRSREEPAGADERVRLLRRAGEWLLDEIADLEAMRAEGRGTAARVASVLDRWLEDRDLDPLRAGPALEALPEAAGAALREAWERARALAGTLE